MKAYMSGWHTRHAPDFNKERPNGIHGMQIILVQSKARIGMGSNIFDVEENRKILYNNTKLVRRLIEYNILPSHCLILNSVKYATSTKKQSHMAEKQSENS